MKIVCVTGKMAAGKNYISSQMEKDGWLSLDFDQLVHKAIEETTPQIEAAFKEPARQKNLSLKNPDGTLNRRAIGQLVFANPELLKTQEQIVYPVIIKMAKDFVSQNQQRNIIFNATVLYKTPELLQLCDSVIFVTAPLLVRLFRAHKRDGIPYRQLLKRFKSQKKLLDCYRKSGKPVKIINNL